MLEITQPAIDLEGPWEVALTDNNVIATLLDRTDKDNDFNEVF